MEPKRKNFELKLKLEFTFITIFFRLNKNSQTYFESFLLVIGLRNGLQDHIRLVNLYPNRSIDPWYCGFNGSLTALKNSNKESGGSFLTCSEKLRFARIQIRIDIICVKNGLQRKRIKISETLSLSVMAQRLHIL